MSTTPQQRLACFDEMDAAIAGYRSTVQFSGDDGFGPVFDQVERMIAEGRRADLGRMQATSGSGSVNVSGGGTLPGRSVTFTQPPAPAGVSAERRAELLGCTDLGRACLAAETAENPPALPDRVRELIGLSSVGNALLAADDRARFAKGA